MFVEQRIYTIKPGQVPDYLALYEAEGFAVQTHHLGQPVGYYSSEIGELSQIVHIWRYEDLADRQRRRAALFADPAWKSVVTKLYAMIDRMENKILVPAPFFKLS